MGFKTNIRKFIKKTGYDLQRYRKFSDPLERRGFLFASYGIDLVLDVGANIGGYASGMRANTINYKGRILSYEPLSSAFSELSLACSSDPLWIPYNFALGDVEEKSIINISANSQSSSFSEMLPAHLDTSPDSEFIGSEEVTIKTIDSIFDEHCKGYSSILLKIDAQGYEINVLHGAKESLNKIDTIQLEMSLVPLYKDELLFCEMYGFLEKQGYTMVSIEPGFSDHRTGQLLQADGIFHRFN